MVEYTEGSEMHEADSFFPACEQNATYGVDRDGTARQTTGIMIAHQVFKKNKIFK